MSVGRRKHQESFPGQETNVVIYFKMPRRKVMPCPLGSHERFIERGEKRGREGGRTSPWGLESEDRKRKKERQEVGKTHLLRHLPLSPWSSEK